MNCTIVYMQADSKNKLGLNEMQIDSCSDENVTH